MLISNQLPLPPAASGGSISGGVGPCLAVRNDANRSLPLRVDERGGDFTEIFHPQRAVANRTASAHFDAIAGAPVGFRDDEESFVPLGEIEFQQASPKDPHAHPEHLTRTEMIVSFGAQPEKMIE